MSDQTQADYKTFGDEWEKEIIRLPKNVLVDMLRNQGKELEYIRIHIRELLDEGMRDQAGVCDSHPLHFQVFRIISAYHGIYHGITTDTRQNMEYPDGQC
jgi:hypothetical protein